MLKIYYCLQVYFNFKWYGILMWLLKKHVNRDVCIITYRCTLIYLYVFIIDTVLLLNFTYLFNFTILTDPEYALNLICMKYYEIGVNL